MKDAWEEFGFSEIASGSRGHIPAWFVQQQIAMTFGRLDAAPVDADVIVREIGFGAQFGDDVAVHANTALLNHLFGLSARRHTGMGKNLLEPLLHDLI